MLEILPQFLSDAVIDSIKLVPSLFLIFIFIEIFENFFAHKISDIVSFSKKLGPVVAAILAIIPQCGFSVVMTTLFIKRYVTIGTLISTYIATSDEAIAILLTNIDNYPLILKIIVIKLVWAIFIGYFVDLIIKTPLHICAETSPCSHLKEVEIDDGCCSHKINEKKIKNLIFHPIKHTFIIFIFIFAFCVVLNYFMQGVNEQTIVNFSMQHKVLEILFFSFFGLIPNCAVSVLITMLFLKGVISFGSALSALCSNSGLGLLILFTQKENLKKFFIIVLILVLSGFLAGLICDII